MTSIITSEFIAKCTADFKAADANGDGFLDFEEFRVGTGCSPAQVRQVWTLFQRFDKDGNGVMDLDEFIAMAATLKGATANEIDETLAGFLLLDKDRNGYISKEEFHEFCLSTNPAIAQDNDKFQATFQAFDTNKDGRIDYAEFKRMTTATRAAKGEGEESDPDRRAFIMIDRDGDGVITPEEFHKFCLSYNPVVATNEAKFATTFKIIDGDGNGGIDYAEFKRFLEATRRAITTNGKVDEDLLNFSMIDTDGSGSISPDELCEYCRICNPEVASDPQRFKGMFNLIDANGDGSIDFEEFRRVARSYRAALVDGKIDQDKVVFFLVDKDGDGYVTLEEFHKFLVAINPGTVVEEKKAKKIFKKYDDDRDGRINFEGFKGLLREATK